MKRFVWLVTTIAFLGTLWFVTPAFAALTVPSAPPIERAVVDQTGTLTDQQISELSSLIYEGERQKDYEMAVLIIPTVGSEVLEDYSLNVARTWGIGQKKSNNGVLILVAKNDRRARIEVGYGLEGNINDAKAGRIIRNVMSPKFKANNYYDGLKDGIIELQNAVDGKPESEVATAKSSGSDVLNLIANLGFFALFGFTWVVSIIARSKSWWAGGVIGIVVGLIIAAVAGFVLWSVVALIALGLFGFVLDYFVSKNYKETLGSDNSPSWWAGGTGWGGGGGGGGSFGGGSFGGGGASGDW